MRGPWYCDGCGKRAQVRLTLKTFELRGIRWWGTKKDSMISDVNREFCPGCLQEVLGVMLHYKAPGLEALAKIKQIQQDARVPFFPGIANPTPK